LETIREEGAMPIKPSRRISRLGAYAFAEIDAAAARLREKGIEPLDLGVGDPATPTPEFVRRACCRGIEERRSSGYPSYIGNGGFRAAAARWMARRFGVDLDPEAEVTATIGSKEAVFNVHEGFVDPGDVVISPSPGYPPYARGALFAEGVNWFYPLEEALDFLPDLDAIPLDTARRARIFWLCQPNIPTGKAVPPRRLTEVAAFCREFDILLCSDEAYIDIYFDQPPDSILQHGRDGVLAFFSLSKRSAMTGYRCGWAAGDAEAIAVFRKVKTNIDSGTPSFVQDAAVAALSDEIHVQAMREDYRRKRDLLVEALGSAGFPRCLPETGLYIWQRVPEGFSGLDVARRLLEPDMAVITAPGAWLAERLPEGSNPGRNFVRFSLTPPFEQIEEAARRLQRFSVR
jgi:LL-diaminopimelate aminotransferase